MDAAIYHPARSVAATGSQVASDSGTSFYVSPSTINQGIGMAKAWAYAQYSGTIVVYNSYNTSSITSNALGDATWTFSTTFQNGSWVFIGNAFGIPAAKSILPIEQFDTIVHSGSQIRLYLAWIHASTPGLADPQKISLNAFGLQ